MNRPKIAALQLSTRTAAAAVLSITIAQALQLESPISALITAVLATDLSPSATRRRALPRLGGTVVGAAVGAALSNVLPPSLYSVGLGIVAAMILCHLLRLRGAERVAGYVSGIVLLNFSDNPWPYASRRLIETGVAIGMAVLVSFIPKFIPTDEQNR